MKLIPMTINHFTVTIEPLPEIINYTFTRAE